MSNEDIRWIQRLNHYGNGLDKLKDAMEIASERDLSELEKIGVIKVFEFTYELAWNVLKDFFESLGETGIRGSKDAFSLAFNRGLMPEGTLVKMIESRNQTTHTYNQETANKIFHEICENYYAVFEQLRNTLLQEKDNRNL